MRRPPVHPPEPIYPCCLPALGEFYEMAPHEGLTHTLAHSRQEFEPPLRHPVATAIRVQRPTSAMLISARCPRQWRTCMPGGFA